MRVKLIQLEWKEKNYLELKILMKNYMRVMVCPDINSLDEGLLVGWNAQKNLKRADVKFFLVIYTFIYIYIFLGSICLLGGELSNTTMVAKMYVVLTDYKQTAKCLLKLSRTCFFSLGLIWMCVINAQHFLRGKYTTNRINYV